MPDTARLTTALADRYTIVREIGAGGMATVYLARDLKHDREVALKVLRPELAAVLGADRFLNEIKIAARLDHPHILTLIDSGATDGFLFYVMPYVRGESLRAKLTREHQLGLEESVAITKQVASALDYAHRQGIVHRDIKPENILLQEGEAMLTDFGIALAVKEAGGNRLTETGLSLGTPQYMSPEQATGDRTIDARSDVYSLAAVLYEMLAGEPPVTGANAQAMIAKLMTERPTRLRVVRDTVPEGIDNAVAKALAKVPADRYSGAGEFASSLAASSGAARPGPQRSRLIAALAVAGILLLALGVMVARTLRSGAQNVHVVLRDRTQLTSTGNVSHPAISEDGKALVYGATDCRPAPCRHRIEVQDLGAATTRTLLDSATRIDLLLWSPDRRGVALVGVLGGRSGTYLLPTLGGEPRPAPDLQSWWAGGDSMLLSPVHQKYDSLWWLYVAGLDGVARDSIRIAGRALGFTAWAVPLTPWIVVGLSSAEGAEWRIIDRLGRTTSRLSRPEVVLSYWPSVDALWLQTQRGSDRSPAILRLPLDARTGRLSDRPDTVYLGNATEWSVTADGGTLVVDEGARDYELFGVTRGEALRGVLSENRRLLRTTTLMDALLSPDGARLLVHRARLTLQSGGELAVMPFAGGAERPLALYGTLRNWSWSDSVTVALSEELGPGTRLSLVDVRTGERRNALTIPSERVGEISALPAGGWAWITPEVNKVRVQRSGESAPTTLSVTDWFAMLRTIQSSPDGRSLLVRGWNATSDSMRVGVLNLSDGTMTRWATMTADLGRIRWLKDGSVLVVITKRPGSFELLRAEGPGKLRTLGTIPRPISWISMSDDLSRAVIITESNYRGDAWSYKVVRP